MPDDVWQSRHRFLLTLTWLHAISIALSGPILGYAWEFGFAAIFLDGMILHTVAEGLFVGLFAAIAAWGTSRRIIQAMAVGFGLMSSSAFLVHLLGGLIEAHFHFFLMVAFLALYQHWMPYLLGIFYIALHHGVLGVLWPEQVYSRFAALNAPWSWTVIRLYPMDWRRQHRCLAFQRKAIDSGSGFFWIPSGRGSSAWTVMPR